VPRQADGLRTITHGKQSLSVLGNPELLNLRLLGFLCSIRCPGNLIVQCYDLARALRDAHIPVIGGFHTPMEREALDFLIKGQQPIIICPARSLDRMRPSFRSGLWHHRGKARFGTQESAGSVNLDCNWLA
jgi:hypothetical protein